MGFSRLRCQHNPFKKTRRRNKRISTPMPKDIFEAIEELDVKSVTRYCSQGTTLNDKRKGGNTPLHVACAIVCQPETRLHELKLTIVRNLVLWGAKLVSENDNREYPVDIAIQLDDYAVVRFLTDQKTLSSTHGVCITKDYLKHAMTTARNANVEHLVKLLSKELKKSKDMSRKELLQKANTMKARHDISSPMTRFTNEYYFQSDFDVDGDMDSPLSPKRPPTPQLLNSPEASPVRPPPDFSFKPPQITNLVWQGGGVLGIAYVGVLKQLEAQGVKHQNLKRVAGTSAGALFAGLMAVGYEADSILEILTPPFSQFLDDANGAKKKFEDLVANFLKDSTSLFTKLDMVYEISTLFVDRLEKDLGIFSGDTFLNKYRGYIFNKTGKKNLTFKQLHELVEKDQKTYKDLYVIAHDIQTGESKIFSYESTPDAEVALCCRMSMSVPLVFQPVKFPPNSPDQHMFVDGGEGMNFPLTIFDKERYCSGMKSNSDKECVNEGTLGVRLVDMSTMNHYLKGTPLTARAMPTNDLRGLVRLMLYLATQDRHIQENLYSYADPKSERTVFVDSSNINFINFNLSDSEKELLMRAGKVGVESFFERMRLTQLKEQLKTLEEQMEQEITTDDEGTEPATPPTAQSVEQSQKEVVAYAQSVIDELEKKNSDLSDRESSLTQELHQLKLSLKTSESEVLKLRSWKSWGFICMISAIVLLCSLAIVIYPNTTNEYSQPR